MLRAPGTALVASVGSSNSRVLHSCSQSALRSWLRRHWGGSLGYVRRFRPGLELFSAGGIRAGCARWTEIAIGCASSAGSASRPVSPHRGSVEGYLFLRGRSWRPCRPRRREVGLGEESKKSLGCLCSARLYLHQTPGICAVVGSGKLPFSYWQHSSHGFRSESVTHQGKASSTFAVFWLSIY